MAVKGELDMGKPAHHGGQRHGRDPLRADHHMGYRPRTVLMGEDKSSQVVSPEDGLSFGKIAVSA